MKKLIFLSLFCLFSGVLSAQIFVGDVNINDPANGVHYIEVVLTDVLKGYIDYGSGEKVRDLRNKEIKDGEGNTPGLSRMEVFNFLARNGWEFVVFVAQDTYLFKRKTKE